MAETQRPASAHDTNGVPATDARQAPVRSVVLRTPPGWQVFDLAELGDARATQERICRSIDGHVNGGEAFAAAVAQLAAGAGGLGVFFAAISVPGQQDGTDLTSVTLAAAKPPAQRGDRLGDARGAESASGPAQATAESGARVAESVVSLPAGEAIRIESADVLPINDVPALPVFCVQYALGIPASDWALVITFTTIGPSSIARLRAQFSQIASTLELV